MAKKAAGLKMKGPDGILDVLFGIRNEINRTDLVIRMSDTGCNPDRERQKQEILEGLKPSLDKRLDKLDKLLGIQTKTS